MDHAIWRPGPAHYCLVSLLWAASGIADETLTIEKQLTIAPHGHILTNTAVWSPDSRWIVYDVRSDPAGDQFDAKRIERVDVETGEIQLLYQATGGACCGVVTYSTCQDRVVFILGPEHPSDQWSYSAYHRRGVVVDVSRPGIAINLDARDLVPPFTPGALRGGTHVHTYSGDSRYVAFTYEDHILATSAEAPGRERNQRNVGVSFAGRSVRVQGTHPRNHDGTHFSVLVTRTTDQPVPGSDEISRAYSDAWVGSNGYLRTDGTRQAKAIAFQGRVTTSSGEQISEVFIVDLPDDVTRPSSDGPLQGTIDRRPHPPAGARQRRLTFSSQRTYPGIQGVRHWLRSCADGSKIAFLSRDDQGLAQLWTVSPTGGAPRQITRNPFPIESAFSWTPDGDAIAHVMDHSVCLTDVETGQTVRLTERDPATPLRPEACVVSPDGAKIAVVRQVTHAGGTWNQIFVVHRPGRN